MPSKKRTEKTIQAVILAAGEGKSLFPLTRDCPKASLKVSGISILKRLIQQLNRFGVRHAAVVVGYQKEKVTNALAALENETGMTLTIIENDRFAETNTLYSVALAEKYCRNRSLLLIDGDLVCEDAIFEQLGRANAGAVLAVDTARVMGEEEVKVRIGPRNVAVAIGKNLASGSAEFLGLCRFSPAVTHEFFLDAKHLLKSGNQSHFYEAAFSALMARHQVTCLDVSGLKWVEVDFMQDYEEALRLFGLPDELKTFRASRRSRRHYLFCPGPVLVSDRVKKALASPEIGHREVEFSELFNRVRLKLARVFGVRNLHRYTCLVLNGSGSAANEAVLSSLGAKKKLLIISNGEFGERLVRLAEFLELDSRAIRLRWGQPFDLDDVEKAVRRSGMEMLCFVHHETSTGMLNPLPKLAAIAKRHSKEIFVDAVSSLGAVPVNVEDNELTFCTGSANKAIASVPGLSFVCGKRAAFSALKGVKPRSLYLDLYNHFVYSDRKYQTPNTPAVNLFFALEAALDGILDGGLQKTFDRYSALAAQLRSGIKALGFRFFLPEEHMSPVLTTVELPVGFEGDDFHERLKRLGYITYPGKGILKDRAFQVANIGEISHSDVTRFIDALAGAVK